MAEVRYPTDLYRSALIEPVLIDLQTRIRKSRNLLAVNIEYTRRRQLRHANGRPLLLRFPSSSSGIPTGLISFLARYAINRGFYPRRDNDYAKIRKRNLTRTRVTYELQTWSSLRIENSGLYQPTERGIRRKPEKIRIRSCTLIVSCDSIPIGKDRIYRKNCDGEATRFWYIVETAISWVMASYIFVIFLARFLCRGRRRVTPVTRRK